MSADSFERAARVAAGVATDDDLRWLQAGFGAWQRAGGEVPLDRILRLAGAKRGRLAMRDALLRELVDVVPRRDGEGAATAALRALATFRRERWPLWHGYAVAPEGATRVERVAFDLLALRLTLPRTARGLRMRLARNASRVIPSDAIQGARRAA